MSPRAPSAGAYARAIAGTLERVQGRAVLLSPRDFRYVADWQARGIPLALVCEAIVAAAAPRRRRSARPRIITLAYVAPAVEEGWGVVLSGRTLVPAPAPVPPADPSAVRQRWAAAAERAGAGSPLALLLTEAVRALEAGADAAAIDRAVDDGLPQATPTAAVTAIESRIAEDLRGFAAGMTPAGLATTRRRALVDRLRQSLQLPRLSGRGRESQNGVIS